jgi:hypothetical protein
LLSYIKHYNVIGKQFNIEKEKSTLKKDRYLKENVSKQAIKNQNDRQFI